MELKHFGEIAQPEGHGNIQARFLLPATKHQRHPVCFFAALQQSKEFGENEKRRESDGWTQDKSLDGSGSEHSLQYDKNSTPPVSPGCKSNTSPERRSSPLALSPLKEFGERQILLHQGEFLTPLREEQSPFKRLSSLLSSSKKTPTLLHMPFLDVSIRSSSQHHEIENDTDIEASNEFGLSEGSRELLLSV